MTVDHDHDSYYPYKQPGSVPFNWEIRPGVPKHNHNHHPSPPQPPTRTAISSPKLKPPPPISFHYPLEEPRTRSLLSAPRTRSILSSSPSPRTHSQRILSTPQPGPKLVGPGCFPSPSKQDRMSSGRGSRRRNTGQSRRVDSEYGFDSGPDYGSDLEVLVRWSSSISAMRKSNAAYHYSSPDSSASWSTSPSPVCPAEWDALNLF